MKVQEVLKRKAEGNAQITVISVITLVMLLLILLFGMFQLSTEYLAFKSKEVFREALMAGDCIDRVCYDTGSEAFMSCNGVTHCTPQNCIYENNTSGAAISAAYNAAQERFKQSIQTGLKLDSQMNPLSSSPVKSVMVESFKIYNVTDSFIYEYDGSTVTEYPNNSDITAPDGTVIKNSGIYAKIQIKLNDYTGMTTLGFDEFMAVRTERN